MIKMQLQIDKRFKTQVKGRFERFQFEAGILQNKPYKLPRRPRSIGTLQGGPVRRTGSKTAGSIADVSEVMRKRTNFYTKPFRKRKKPRELQEFIKEFFRLASRKTTSYARVEATLRSVIRLPILRGEYGKANTKITRRIKGFSRFMFDTGQLFKGIAAKVRSRKNV